MFGLSLIFFKKGTNLGYSEPLIMEVNIKMLKYSLTDSIVHLNKTLNLIHLVVILAGCL